MVAVVGIRTVGNNLLETFSDGSVRWFRPTTTGFFIPTSREGGSAGATGAGGGEDQAPPPSTGTPGSVAAPVNDYPWPNAPQDSMSPLRYSYRDCTDFAAWRINRDLGATSAPWMYTWGQLRLTNGNAVGWRADWQTHGWGVSTSPKAGTIGWYGLAAWAQAYGHVCYIQHVAADGTVTIEEYNWAPYHQAYNTSLRTAAPGSAYYPDAFLDMPPKR
jgi:surface antigen